MNVRMEFYISMKFKHQVSLHSVDRYRHWPQNFSVLDRRLLVAIHGESWLRVNISISICNRNKYSILKQKLHQILGSMKNEININLQMCILFARLINAFKARNNFYIFTLYLGKWSEVVDIRSAESSVMHMTDTSLSQLRAFISHHAFWTY